MTASVTVTVTLRDARRLGYCASGCRAWCERHGFAWMDFRGAGLPLADVAATGDAMALRLVQSVSGAAAQGGVDDGR